MKFLLLKLMQLLFLFLLLYNLAFSQNDSLKYNDLTKIKYSGFVKTGISNQNNNKIIPLYIKGQNDLLTRNILCVISGALFLAVLIIYLLFRKNNNKKKALLLNKIELLKKENKQSQNALKYSQRKKKKLEEEIQNYFLREEKLISELEFYSKQLATYTLQFIQKNKVLIDIKEKIKNLRKTRTGFDDEIKQTLKLIESNLNNKKEWDNFKMYFERGNKNFFKNLTIQFPDLTANDLRFSALCKMNLQIKEAASIMAISANSVKSARYRLRKKLNLSTEDNLNEFLIKFDNNN